MWLWSLFTNISHYRLHGSRAEGLHSICQIYCHAKYIRMVHLTQLFLGYVYCTCWHCKDIFYICVALVQEQKYLSHTKNELWHHRFGRLRSHQIQCSKFPPQGVPFINNGTPCDPSAMVVDTSNADFCHILARLSFLVTAVHVMLWMPVMLLCCTVVTQPCLLSSQHQIWYELHPKPLSRKLLRSTQNWMAFWHFKRIKKKKKDWRLSLVEHVSTLLLTAWKSLVA